MNTPITSIEITIHEPDLANFLDETSDVDNACEQYRAEYERRLSEQYPAAKITVSLGETNGMGNNYYINDELTTAGSGEYQDEIPWIDDVANSMVNDWDWLTV